MSCQWLIVKYIEHYPLNDVIGIALANDITITSISKHEQVNFWDQAPNPSSIYTDVKGIQLFLFFCRRYVAGLLNDGTDEGLTYWDFFSFLFEKSIFSSVFYFT